MRNGLTTCVVLQRGRDHRYLPFPVPLNVKVGVHRLGNVQEISDPGRCHAF